MHSVATVVVPTYRLRKAMDIAMETDIFDNKDDLKHTQDGLGFKGSECENLVPWLSNLHGTISRNVFYI